MSDQAHLSKQPRTVFAFACRVANVERWGETIYNAHTAGAAKEQHWRHVSDAWDGIKYTDIRARKVGAPHSSEQFIHNARYRGMPDVRCGQRVRTNGCDGVIVGHNASANFDVLFESGRYVGQTLNVHPSEIELVS